MNTGDADIPLFNMAAITQGAASQISEALRRAVDVHVGMRRLLTTCIMVIHPLVKPECVFALM
jgi:hypothetical protein